MHTIAVQCSPGSGLMNTDISLKFPRLLCTDYYMPRSGFWGGQQWCLMFCLLYSGIVDFKMLSNPFQPGENQKSEDPDSSILVMQGLPDSHRIIIN